MTKPSSHENAPAKTAAPGKRPWRVGLISLGCAKNLVDAEIMLGSLLKEGMEITNDAAQADALIVNTCSFIASAQEESVDAILESAEVRDARNRGQSLIVAGCLPQRFRDELPRLLPEVDAFMGIDQVARVSEIVKGAIQKRGERLNGSRKKGNQKSEARSQKKKIVGRLAEIEKNGLDNEEATRNMRRAVDASEAPLHEPTDQSQGSTESRPTVRFKAQMRDSGILEAPHELKESVRRSPSSRPSPPGEGGSHSDGLERRAIGPVQGFNARIFPGNLTRDLAPLLEVNPRPNFIPDFATPRFRLTPRHFAYLKIAEGCNHPCSFCIIPRMRGSHRSRPQKDIVAEAKALIAEGVKEIVLISQDSTYYGLDFRPRHGRAISSPEKFSAAAKSLAPGATTICTLLRELNALEGDFWIRLLYTHPAHWTDELIQTIADCPKVARYVDLPLQHIHDNMLERMRRETSRPYIADLIKKIRAGVPGIALRTTFIVGFPGETEGCFDALLDFIRETRFERLGVFAYSRQDGTRAGAMAGQIPDRVKERRRRLAMAEQQKIARQISRSLVGREIKVLVEGKANLKNLENAQVVSWEHGFLRGAPSHPPSLVAPHSSIARSQADAPDIDGRVFVRGQPPIGEFARVKIIGHTDYDLIAEAL